MSTITIRYFAAARAAASGVRQEEFQAASPAQALELAAATHGPELARVIGISSYLLDGVSLLQEDTGQPVTGNAVLDVMPPFAGG